MVLRVLAVLGCTELTTLPDGTILEATNLTLLNVLLLRFGPMREKCLTQALIAVQVRLAVISRARTRLLMIPLGGGERSCLYGTLWLGVFSLRWRSALESHALGFTGQKNNTLMC